MFRPYLRRTSGHGWRACWLLLVFCAHLRAAGPATGSETNLSASYNVSSYVIEGKTLLPTNQVTPLMAKHTGTNVSVEEIMRAAADLQSEYRRQGQATMNIVIAPKQITNGIVRLDVFPGAVAQIVVSGKRYLVSTNGVETTVNLIPPTGSALAGAKDAAAQKAAEMTAQAKAAQARGASSNAGPRFKVEQYLVLGNTVLPPATIGKTLAGVTNAYGTNVSFDGIRAAATALQAAYQARGYATVAVGLPQQKLTNATVKVQVTEGRLVAIDVKGNHYFSSNNVMRSLPGLHTNQIINSLTFQEELNRANANQDRQIYPVVGPGPDPGTSALTLDVKDRPPVHAKVELNDQSSPGTPDLRVNSSAVYDNLWQLDHSLGVQYNFSPELYKDGPQWNPYDQPLVANYSGFYRMPLGRPESIEDVIATHPGSFGYDEATRKFILPPPSGQPELTFFASRSTIDTGLTATPEHNLSSTFVTNAAGNAVTTSTLNENSEQQDLTVNNDLGFRLNMPLTASPDFHSSVSGGLDFKTYQVNSLATNDFNLNVLETVYTTPPYSYPVMSTNYSAIPYTVKNLQYLPLSLRYDAGWHDPLGTAAFGLGLSANLWLSGLSSVASSSTNQYYRGVKSLQFITGSTESSGHWVVLTPSFSHTLDLVTNWPTTFKADGQWASEPLINNEEFGAGGINSVRGYHEGEVFGDMGWHVSLEQQTPPHLVGDVYDHAPLTVRGVVYMDYADTYLLDPLGRSESTALWGTGFGGMAAIGSHWEARFLFSLPLLRTASTEPYQPFFNFALTAQF